MVQYCLQSLPIQWRARTHTHTGAAPYTAALPESLMQMLNRTDHPEAPGLTVPPATLLPNLP